jgi:YidC/Oxa1 family membrane protein insertase
VKIFEPLYDLVSWIIRGLHKGFSGMGMNASWSWCLAIVGLVVIIRICLIPLFVKQIRSMRNMQVLQPKIRKIQERYKGDREKTSQELMKLYKEEKTNPLSSCLPILAQAPIFFALYKVLDGISKGKPYGVLDQEDVDSARSAYFFSAALSDKFIGADSASVQIVTVLMILAMSASQFFTQKQLMTKNMPAAAMETNPFMQQQKVLLYLFPILFAVFGINFPVGVLLYWLVSNFWSMGQQLFVIRRMPVAGSPAYEAMMRRKAKKGKAAGVGGISLGKKPVPVADDVDDAQDEESLGEPPVAGGPRSTPPRGGSPSSNGSGAKPPMSTGGGKQRAQPKNVSRSKRSGPGGGGGGKKR